MLKSPIFFGRQIPLDFSLGQKQAERVDWGGGSWSWMEDPEVPLSGERYRMMKATQIGLGGWQLNDFFIFTPTTWGR